jgi:hypothetical protein
MSFIEKIPSSATNEILSARMLIDGAWVEAASSETIAVENSAKRRIIAEVPRGKTEDVNRAVHAAAKAFETWRKVAPRERGRMLERIGDALEARHEDLARLVALETGNALRTQARPEAYGTAGMFRYFGGLAGELKGETVPLGEQLLSYTRREPYGVVGAIIPPCGSRHVENCAGPLRRQHARIEGCRGCPAIGIAIGGDLPASPAARRAQCADGLRRRMRAAAGTSSLGAEAVVHRIDRGRQAHHGRRGRAHRSRVARAWRQKPVDRISRRQRRLGRRWHHQLDALHATESILHRRIAIVPACRYLRQFSRQADAEDAGAAHRRPTRRDERHRQHHQPEAVLQGLRLCGGWTEAKRSRPRVRRAAAQGWAIGGRLFRNPHSLC